MTGTIRMTVWTEGGASVGRDISGRGIRGEGHQRGGVSVGGASAFYNGLTI